MAIWFITGVGRGLGRCLAERALEAGHTVVGTTRDGVCDLPGLHVLPLSVDDPTAARPTVERAVELAGGLDVLVNSAGYGLLGPVEETTDEQAAQLFEVNFFGPLRLTRAALPHLRRSRGHLVNITSIAALDPLPGSAIYAAAKAAVSALSEAVAREVEPFGVGTTIVGLGSFRTGFLSERSVRHTTPRLDVYATGDDHFAGLSGRQPGDPDRAAELIVQAVDSGAAPLHLVVGEDAVRRTRSRIDALLGDVAAWESRSVATAHT
ncbi:SDR family NAD(P)-dependent oxidoreductase [Pseudonocardia sp. RS010]|uniref:SDR family NAD(P)-dependent oxidoreductase n=1 Tax=Pseudonocardia sp. RS010 TaxID=3385979 RepID=UPI0039A0CE63